MADPMGVAFGDLLRGGGKSCCPRIIAQSVSPRGCIYPDVEMFQKTKQDPIESREVAIKFLRQFLYVKQGTEPDRRLISAANELLKDTPDGVVPYGAKWLQQGLISWRPGWESACSP